MIVKHIRCAIILLMASVILHAGQITITGQYVDKKSNPIAGASVEYFANIAQLDSTNTDDNGNFTLNIQTVNIVAEAIPEKFSLSQNYPNPFNPETRIQCSIPNPASLTFYNIRGQLVDQIHLPTPGAYTILWGGADRFGKSVGAGIYIMTLNDKNVSITKRLTLLDSGNGSRMRIDNSHNTGKQQDILAKPSTNDEIHFIKHNTVKKIIQLSAVTSDTGLGIITGNVGPELINPIFPAVVDMGTELTWYLNDHVYNDDQIWYFPRDTAHFKVHYVPIQEGDRLTFASSDTGVFTTIIDIVDYCYPDELRDSMTVMVTVNAVNEAPVQIASIPDTSILEDRYFVLYMPDYVVDPDGDVLDCTVNLPVDQWWYELDDLVITPVPDFNGTLEEIVITASDSEFSTSLNAFDLVVESVNDAPVFAGEISDAVVSLGDSFVVDLSVYFSDVDSDLSYGVNLPDSVWGLNGDLLTITPVGYDNLDVFVTASDEEFSIESNHFLIDIPMPVDVHFVMKDYFTDTTLVSDTCTWWIGEETFQTTNGELDVQLKTGAYEFNATNPKTADGAGWEYADYYVFLRRSSDTECFEQRARDDYSSPITITDDDTIHVYKLMLDWDLLNGLGCYVDPAGVGTVRFSESDLQAPAWMNLKYDAPNSNTLLWMNRLWTALYEATGNKLDMQYEEGTNHPLTPSLEMTIGHAGPTNGTFYDADNNITWCQAEYPIQPSGYQLWIEVIQAVTNLYDSGGVDPPIISVDDEGCYINDLGQKLLKFIYFVNPKTKI